MLDKFFNITKSNSSIKTEIYAGFITFFAMSYIIFVNPIILKSTGISVSSVFIATALVSAFAAFIMAFYVKLPLVASTGMGLNAVFTYTIVLTMGYSWQNALALVFLEGVAIFLVAVFVNINFLINAIPNALKQGATAGIGAFIILISLNNSNIIISHPATLVTLGNIHSIISVSVFSMFFILLWAHYKKLHFMPLISIVLLTLLSLFINTTHYSGVVSFNINLSDTFFKFSFSNILNFGALIAITIIFLSSFFDSFGALLSYNYLTGNTKASLNNINTKRAIQVNGLASMLAGVLGTSSATIFLESNAGVSFGGRTGLSALVIGLLFLTSILFSPLISAVPIWAATPVLMYLGFLMLSALKEINWSDISQSVPALICVVFMPLTYSVSYGIAFGFISYVVLKILLGKYKEVNFLVYLLTIMLIIGFIVK